MRAANTPDRFHRAIMGMIAVWTATALLTLGADPLPAQTFNAVSSATIASHVSFSLGASWVDFDQDGDLDLYVVTGFVAANDNVLYRNDGGDTFIRITGVPETLDGADTACSTWADFDNDGAVDAFVSNLVSQGGMLFAGTGGGGMALDTMAGVGGAALKGTGCAWGDYDSDGHLDLVIAALYGQGGITTPNRLFHNEGDGTFTEVLTGPEVTTLDTHHYPTWSDYDLDGDLDLFFATGPVGSKDTDRMYRNMLVETGSPTFDPITTGIFATDTRDSQTLRWIDYDNDGDLDMFAVNYSSTPNQLYRNDGGGTFIRVGGAFLTAGSTSHGCTWGDFDNDGDLDVYVARDLSLANLYFRNEGGDLFTRITSGAFVTATRSNYGAVSGDYDGDGDLDLFVPTARSEGPSVLYRNDTTNGNHWIVLRLQGVTSNRSGVGAKVHVLATIGGAPRWQMREVLAGTGYGGQDALEAHFGLGGATTVDSVRVEWPGGGVDALQGLAVDQRHAIMEGVALDAPAASAPPRLRLSAFPNPLRDRNTVRFTLPGDQAVALEVFDATGRRVLVLAHGRFDAGQHGVVLDAARLPGAGLYFLRLTTASGSIARRVVRLR